MLLRPASCRRSAATLVEGAITYTVVFLLTLGMIVVSLIVHDYQQVAALAREGARWASVHGGQYNQETGNAMATQSTVRTNGILPYTVGLDTSQFNGSNPTVTWDDSSEMPTYLQNGSVVTNYVTVTLTYTWNPGAYLSSVTLQSTSKMAVQY